MTSMNRNGWSGQEKMKRRMSRNEPPDSGLSDDPDTLPVCFPCGGRNPAALSLSQNTLWGYMNRSICSAFLLFGMACDIILSVLDWEWIVRFSGTLFTSTSDFVYIEGLGNQVNRHLAHAEFCVRKMCTPGWKSGWPCWKHTMVRSDDRQALWSNPWGRFFHFGLILFWLQNLFFSNIAIYMIPAWEETVDICSVYHSSQAVIVYKYSKSDGRHPVMASVFLIAPPNNDMSGCSSFALSSMEVFQKSC